MTDTDDAEDLLQQSKQKRHETDPADSQETPSLKAAIKRELEAIDDDEKPQNVTIRDGNLVALLDGLDEAGELDAIVADARAALGRDGDVVSRSEAARLLIRIGLAEVSPDAIRTAVEAQREHESDNIQF
jgi:hypothetical protein